MEKTENLNLQANIEYHTKLARGYDKTQPHFRQENQKQVKKLMEEYSKKTSGKRLLDLGCGTGFIIFLAKSYFTELYGVDITPAMLDLATKKIKNKKQKNIKLSLQSSDNLSFPNNYFDVVTAYSFLHHLSSPLPTLKEVYRVLRDGGIFYSDLDPNYYFWQSIKSVAKEKNVSDLLKIDIYSICQMIKDVLKTENNLDPQVIKNAEYIESFKGGFKEKFLKKIFARAGFKKNNFEYHWFWQEGRVIKDLSLNDALYFEKHLRLALPITKNLFKYIKIEAIK